MPTAATRLMTAQEVAARLRRSKRSVVRWAKTGVIVNGVRVRLESERVGAYYRFTPAALDRFRAACESAAAAR